MTTYTVQCTVYMYSVPVHPYPSLSGVNCYLTQILINYWSNWTLDSNTRSRICKAVQCTTVCIYWCITSFTWPEGVDFRDLSSFWSATYTRTAPNGGPARIRYLKGLLDPVPHGGNGYRSHKKRN